MKVADLVFPFAVAETLTVVAAPTGFVRTPKLALADPAGTVTEGGIVFTAAAPLATVSDTIVSTFTAAGNVTVPVVVPPPVTVVGENVKAERILAVTLKE